MNKQKLVRNPRTHTIEMIYQDPITKQKPEGKACLLSKVQDMEDGLELWNVCFEGEDGEVYQRIV